MLKCAFASLVLLGLIGDTAFAQTKLDCGRAYKEAWDKVQGEPYRKMSAEQLATVSRLSLRAYDACQAGDEQNATLLFEKVALFIDDLGATGPYNPNQPSR
jgi:hypothetical protein